MLQAIERYMKQAIVDKVPSVSSSALVSSLVRRRPASSRQSQQRNPLQGSGVVCVVSVVTLPVLLLLSWAAHGEDELRRGEALGERGPGGGLQ